MSDFAEKLEQRRPSVGDKARATRKQLLARRGASLESVYGAERIIVDTIGGREVWRRVSGDMFEQEVRT